LKRNPNEGKRRQADQDDTSGNAHAREAPRWRYSHGAMMRCMPDRGASPSATRSWLSWKWGCHSVRSSDASVQLWCRPPTT